MVGHRAMRREAADVLIIESEPFTKVLYPVIAMCVVDRIFFVINAGAIVLRREIVDDRVVFNQPSRDTIELDPVRILQPGTSRSGDIMDIVVEHMGGIGVPHAQWCPIQVINIFPAYTQVAIFNDPPIKPTPSGI